MTDLEFNKELEKYKKDELNKEISAFKVDYLRSHTDSKNIKFAQTAGYTVDITKDNKPDGEVIGQKKVQVVHVHSFETATTKDPDKMLNVFKLSGKSLKEGMENVKPKFSTIFSRPATALTYNVTAALNEATEIINIMKGSNASNSVGFAKH